MYKKNINQVVLANMSWKLKCTFLISLKFPLHILHILRKQHVYFYNKYTHILLYTFYNVYVALLLYTLFVHFDNFISIHVLEQYATFKTILWNKTTKHKKELDCHCKYNLTINQIKRTYLRREKNVVRTVLSYTYLKLNKLKQDSMQLNAPAREFIR